MRSKKCERKGKRFDENGNDGITRIFKLGDKCNKKEHTKLYNTFSISFLLVCRRLSLSRSYSWISFRISKTHLNASQHETFFCAGMAVAENTLSSTFTKNETFSFLRLTCATTQERDKESSNGKDHKTQVFCKRVNDDGNFSGTHTHMPKVCQSSCFPQRILYPI